MSPPLRKGSKARQRSTLPLLQLSGSTTGPCQWSLGPQELRVTRSGCVRVAHLLQQLQWVLLRTVCVCAEGAQVCDREGLQP